MVIFGFKIKAVASGVVEGERGTRGNAVPQIYFGNAVPPNDVRTRGNGDTVKVPPSRRAKLQSLW